MASHITNQGSIYICLTWASNSPIRMSLATSLSHINFLISLPSMAPCSSCPFPFFCPSPCYLSSSWNPIFPANLSSINLLPLRSLQYIMFASSNTVSLENQFKKAIKLGWDTVFYHSSLFLILIPILIRKACIPRQTVKPLLEAPTSQVRAFCETAVMILALRRTSPGCCGLLGNEQVSKRPLSLSLSLSIYR